MTYLPSTQLFQTFINNGFKDITNTTYPEHFKKLQESEYNPKVMKRALSYGNSCRVQFEYLRIVTKYKDNVRGTELRDTFSENELKSIITFCKLPSQTRSALRRQPIDIPDLYKRYYDIKEHPEWYKDKGSKSIVEVFESVKLK